MTGSLLYGFFVFVCLFCLFVLFVLLFLLLLLFLGGGGGSCERYSKTAKEVLISLRLTPKGDTFFCCLCTLGNEQKLADHTT